MYKVYQGHRNEGKSGTLMVATTAIISDSATIEVSGNIEIYGHVQISDDVRIFSHKHLWNHSRGLRSEIQEIVSVDLCICQDVFIGVNSIIIGVERIGTGAVIGAGSVLTKNVPDFEVWAGNPARKIGERREFDK